MDTIVLNQFPVGEFFITETSSLKSQRVYASLAEASEVLGDGVSLEVVHVRGDSEQRLIRVYCSKHATCCVLAEKYTKRRSI